jgi:fumarate hydratase class II
MSRQEKDSLGSITVADNCLWGAQTQRSLEHFAISSERMPVALIHALAIVKATCAKVNLELGLLADNKADAIITAAAEISGGQHIDEFPLSVWQTGSGTQTNMNMNEVLANRASELLGGKRGSARLVHPNDEVNLGQSSNDIFPTAMHVAAVLGIVNQIFPAIRRLTVTLEAKSAEFAKIIKIGRTHLQDATPLSLGQEFSGYVAQLQHTEALISASLSSLYPLAVGGTAVGTGLNTSRIWHPGAELSVQTKLPFTSAATNFAALAHTMVCSRPCCFKSAGRSAV